MGTTIRLLTPKSDPYWTTQRSFKKIKNFLIEDFFDLQSSLLPAGEKQPAFIVGQGSMNSATHR
jgi:hypothetical protein